MDNDVLVDGAVVKNFPADIMRSIQLGPIVGVDVGRGRSIEASDIIRPGFQLWRWITLSGRYGLRRPPIVSILMRAATVRAGADSLLAHQAADVLIQPDVDDIEIRDWKAFDPAVEAGYVAATEVLGRLTHPVIDLRRRASLDDIVRRHGADVHGRRGACSSTDRGPDVDCSVVSSFGSGSSRGPSAAFETPAPTLVRASGLHIVAGEPTARRFVFWMTGPTGTAAAWRLSARKAPARAISAANGQIESALSGSIRVRPIWPTPLGDPCCSTTPTKPARRRFFT